MSGIIGDRRGKSTYLTWYIMCVCTLVTSLGHAWGLVYSGGGTGKFLRSVLTGLTGVTGLCYFFFFFSFSLRSGI